MEQIDSPETKAACSGTEQAVPPQAPSTVSRQEAAAQSNKESVRTQLQIRAHRTDGEGKRDIWVDCCMDHVTVTWVRSQ